jgi:mRNA-degrading endonuclease RelE of RelBE toxin-antitoxin system
MQVEFLSKFSKDIDQISQKSVKTNVAKLVRLMESEGDLNNIPNLKKLVGHKSAYRVRIGDYRDGFFTKVEKSFLRELSTEKKFIKCFLNSRGSVHYL